MSLERCRACGGTTFFPVLDLGVTPLANSIVAEADAPQERFPLNVVGCQTCSLVQLTDLVPPERLFRTYTYFSSNSDEMVAHARTLVTRLVRERGLGAGSRVFEIASNDGYLLQHYVAAGVPVLGIEPATNIADVARGRGIDTISEFFGEPLAAVLAAEGRTADVIHANNVMAHVPDIRGFVAGLHRVLKPGGVAVIEAPYVRDLVERCEFDTVYHEHVFYFSLTALVRLCAAEGLIVTDVERLHIHGGSLRLFLTHDGTPSARVRALLDEEQSLGIVSPAYYATFAERVNALRETIVTLLGHLKAGGATLAAYGAAAKGSTLLNYFGIDVTMLDFVADRSVHKQGRYMPGVGIPIVDAQALAERRPDYALLLVWNFAGEVLRQQDAYRRGGGRFIVPIPHVQVL
ncbi:MAG TPA: class I SAM-dependent methyltransferase [Vicinamibacterales bacterium]|nr:class I SAM-dependent methyltransferase [Vicinamibacterales bacterium]